MTTRLSRHAHAHHRAHGGRRFFISRRMTPISLGIGVVYSPFSLEIRKGRRR